MDPLEEHIQFLCAWDAVDVHGGRLPHWQQDRVCVFVTFRLADSIPAHILSGWEEERRAWLALIPEPQEPQVFEAFQRKYATRMEEWLDRGQGSCLLRRQEASGCLQRVIEDGGGKVCALHSWVIMPNHVHLLFSPTTTKIEAILKAWKGTSARHINLALERRSGTLWMKGYYDRLVRDGEHFRRCVAYIRNNPKKAGLAEGEYRTFESDLVKRLVGADL
jgi:putative transposase